MKSVLILTLLACLAVPAHATYYEITTDIYTPGLTLQTGDSLYMTDGGFDNLALFGDSTALIEGTATLEEFFGGIWELDLAGDSHLDFSGGELRNLDMGNNATATLSGGLIESIYSNQWVPYTPGRDGVPNPNIKLYYSGDLPTVDENDLLTGTWLGGGAFAIELHDITGYDPVIENIEFIPEPATLALLACGGLLLRKRRS